MQLVRFFLALCLITFWVTQPARALSLLRDPDIEYALKRIAEPVLQASGLGATRMDILMVDQRSLNAFVVDRGHIFLHSGLILKMDNAAMLQAVMAHEAAHITNGHLARRPVNLRNARTAAGIGAALTAAAAIATGQGQVAGIGAAAASNTAARLFFVHTRAEENAADQSGIRYLIRAGIDPQAMVQVMNLFSGQELTAASRQDPYARTHPLSRDRLRVIKRLADAHTGQFTPDENYDYWFQRAKGKLSAFTRAPKWTLNRAGESGYDDITAMRQAIAYHRQSNLGRAIAAMDRAIEIRPDDGYFRELKGQILFESRQFQGAVEAYAKAAELEPRNALILGSYGRSLMAVGRKTEAIELLRAAHDRDGRDPRVMRDLAQAYAGVGNTGMASLATAERYAMVGKMEDAGRHAKRASDLLPRGSPAWRQAQDVLSAAELAAKQKKRKR